LEDILHHLAYIDDGFNGEWVGEREEKEGVGWGGEWGNGSGRVGEWEENVVLVVVDERTRLQKCTPHLTSKYNTIPQQIRLLPFTAMSRHDGDCVLWSG
jgi:hypothetical protein